MSVACLGLLFGILRELPCIVTRWKRLKADFHVQSKEQRIDGGLDFVHDRLCGLVVRDPGYRSGGPGHYKEKKAVGL
jgi:hypothetical protein